MGISSSAEKDAMNTKTEEGEVIFDIRDLICTKGDVFVENGRSYVCPGVTDYAYPATMFKMQDGRRLDVNLAWYLDHPGGPMTLDLVVIREWVPKGFKNKKKRKYDERGLVRRLATLGKSSYENFKKMELMDPPVCYKEMIRHTFPYGIKISESDSEKTYDILNNYKRHITPETRDDNRFDDDDDDDDDNESSDDETSYGDVPTKVPCTQVVSPLSLSHHSGH